MGEKRPNFAASDSFKEDEPRKLFIGGLSRATTIESMKAYFSAYGNVVDTIVMMDPQGVSRGFGFITFDSTGSVDSVMHQPVHFLDNKQIDVKRSVAKHLRPLPKNQDRSKKVFLGGIPTDMTEAELKEVMSIYGHVIDCSIMYDEKTMKSRGFGFVGFEDEGVIEKLIKQQFIQIKARQVEVKSARPRFPQYQLQQQQQANQMIGPVMPGGAPQSGGPPYDYGYGAYGQGYASTAPGYGQPGPYGPQGGYTPNAGYGPPAPGYGPPRPGYAAPGGYAPPQGYGGQPAYGAPTAYPGYGQPHPAYGAAQQPAPYGAPQAGGYAAPAYGATPEAHQTTDPPAKRMKAGPADVANGTGGAPPAQHPHPATAAPPGPGPAGPAAYDPSNYYAAAAAAYANYGSAGPQPPQPQQQPAPQGAPAPSTAYPGYAYPYPDPSKGAPAPAAAPAAAAAPANPNYWSQYPGYGGYPAPAVPGTG